MKPKKIKAIQFRHEIEKERKMMPEPASLLERAKRFPEAPTHLCASDYGEAISTMREKGYTWKECGEWLRAHGADFTDQAIHSGYQTWWRNTPERQKEDEALRERMRQKAAADRKHAEVVDRLWREGKVLHGDGTISHVRLKVA